MKFEDILIKLAGIHAAPHVVSHSDPETTRIINTHNADAMLRLENLIHENSDTDLVAALVGFLSENWDLIQGTPHSFTTNTINTIKP